MSIRSSRLRRIAAVLLAAGIPLAACAAAAADSPPQIHTVAGGGTCTDATGKPCDGVAATTVPITGVAWVAAVPGGGYLYIDTGSDLVREVSAAGIVTTVAGNGTTKDALNGAPATQSGLDGPVAVAALPQGGFLVTEYGDSLIREVTPDGRIYTIAGTGNPATPGKPVLSGQATSVPLSYPTDAVPVSDGQGNVTAVLIADDGENLVRQLTPAAPGGSAADPSAPGNVSTVAGCDPARAGCSAPCTPGSGDCTPISDPYSVAPLPGGGYLIGERSPSAVLDATGTGFPVAAGTLGSRGFAGDGGPANQALLGRPKEVLATPDGGFLIADTDNNVIRQVEGGIITTVAGDGFGGFSGDGGAATAAALDAPSALALLPDSGNCLTLPSPSPATCFVIADTANSVIREVTTPPVSTITLSPATPNGANGWYTVPVTATVSATENASINCELDPAAKPPAFTALTPGCPFGGAGATVTAGGSHALWSSSQNVFGDTEPPQSVSFRVDIGPPSVICDNAPTFKLGDPGAQVSAELYDPWSGPAAQALTAPAVTSTAGPQTATVTGTNNAGTSGSAACPYTVLPGTLKPPPAVRAALKPVRGGSRIRVLEVTSVPDRASVHVSCSSRGCPFHTAVIPPGTGGASLRTVPLASLFRGRVVPAGTTLMLAVVEPNVIGVRISLTFRRGHAGQAATCLAPGSANQTTSCP